MIADLSNLSKALDQAAPGKTLAAAILSDKARIQGEIASTGSSCIIVNGQKFRIMPGKVTSTLGK